MLGTSMTHGVFGFGSREVTGEHMSKQLRHYSSVIRIAYRLIQVSSENISCDVGYTSRRSIKAESQIPSYHSKCGPKLRV